VARDISIEPAVRWQGVSGRGNLLICGFSLAPYHTD